MVSTEIEVLGQNVYTGHFCVSKYPVKPESPMIQTSTGPKFRHTHRCLLKSIIKRPTQTHIGYDPGISSFTLCKAFGRPKLYDLSQTVSNVFENN